MEKIQRCFFSPKLFKSLVEGSIDRLYEPNKAEKYADIFISIFHIVRGSTYYMSPFIALYAFKMGYFEEMALTEWAEWGSWCCGLCIIVSMVYMLRACGRALNPQYCQFLEALNSPRNMNYIERIREYDFEFYAWPASYVVPVQRKILGKGLFTGSMENTHLPFLKKITVNILAYFAVKTFALKMIYPGTLALTRMILSPALCIGRARMVRENGGERAKVVTADGNSIDTMFIDYRHKGRKGGILVICSEGNSGFYEIGIMGCPIQAGYSVLGYNHPGFAESTGLPYPDQEHNAIDAVMQYAIKDLGFSPSRIVLFGWSIGGYPAAWAATRYPIKALILDATFDDLMPIALNTMPQFLSDVVTEVVRSYINLNISDLLANYEGPIHLVRRTDDEIICLKRGDLATNRGNDLLQKLIVQRHPEIDYKEIEALNEYMRSRQTRRPSVVPEVDQGRKLSLALLKQYLSDFESSHCTPLPHQMFTKIMKHIAAED